MRIEIEKPLFYKRKGDYMLPDSSEMSAESKLFITSNDARFAGALAEAVNEKLANRRNIDVEEINSIIDDCLNADGNRDCRLDVAMLLFNRAGCLAVQMGKCRVMHIGASREEVCYDSRDQVLDIFSNKARVMQITSARHGDFFIATLAQRCDVNEVVKAAANADADSEQRADAILHLLKDPQGDSPSSIMLRVASASGSSRAGVSKRLLLWIVGLAAIIAAGVALYSALPGLLSSLNRGNEVDSLPLASPDSVDIVTTRGDSIIYHGKSDSVAAPATPAVTTPATQKQQAPNEVKNQAKGVYDEIKEVKTPEQPTPEPVKAPEPKPEPAPTPAPPTTNTPTE